jgi:aspartyl-tRNA(Asn)/glutamyl-tRNA(Gln) amidotransferase subunit A
MKDRTWEDLTIAKVAPQIRRGKLSPVDLTNVMFERIEKLNPALNAFLTLTKDQALADARKAEKEIRKGIYRGPLHGIPLSIKDNIAVKGVRTTAGSKILSEWKPDYDATVVKRLREAGAVILGKTNMHEWAKASNTNNVFYGPSRNPWDLNRATGGSSAGCGAAVAAGISMGSIGTDSAGSVRNPASLCGIVGFKPTYGRVSMFGGVAGTGPYSINHFGVLAKTVQDSAFILKCVAGYDSNDPLSADAPVPDYSKSIGKDVRRLKIGIISGYFDELVVDEVREVFLEAIKLLKSLGVKTEEVSIPHMNLIPALQACIGRVEDVSDHDGYLRSSPREYSPKIFNNLIGSLLIPGGAYITAQRVRRLICQEFDEALERVHVIAAPTTAIPAPTIEDLDRGFTEITEKRINLQDPRGNFLTLCTIPFNQTGLPALSLCCGFSSSGLPMGMQIVGKAFEEGTVFQVASAYEKAAKWYERKPPLSLSRVQQRPSLSTFGHDDQSQKTPSIISDSLSPGASTQRY